MARIIVQLPHACLRRSPTVIVIASTAAAVSTIVPACYTGPAGREAWKLAVSSCSVCIRTNHHLISFAIWTPELGSSLHRQASGAKLAAVLVFQEQFYTGVVAPGGCMVCWLLAPHVFGVPVCAVVQQQGHLWRWKKGQGPFNP